tara:strand:- start:170 stop:400 length:231 start_codon:yes stop_codon:yes gene_type:complete
MKISFKDYIYNLIIGILLIIVLFMGLRIEDMKKTSIQRGVECIELMYNEMSDDEILYCLPSLEMLGIKYNPKNTDE